MVAKCTVCQMKLPCQIAAGSSTEVMAGITQAFELLSRTVAPTPTLNSIRLIAKAFVVLVKLLQTQVLGLVGLAKIAIELIAALAPV